jgi:hypothetical protein
MFSKFFVLVAGILVTTSASAQTSECANDDGCPGLQICRFSQCVPRPCSSDDQCPAGICLSKECVACSSLAKCTEMFSKKPTKRWDITPRLRKLIDEALAKRPTAEP